MLLRHKSKINARKRFRRLGVWIVAKNYVHTPKPQIPKCRTKERKNGYKNNTLCFL